MTCRPARLRLVAVLTVGTAGITNADEGEEEEEVKGEEVVRKSRRRRRKGRRKIRG